MSFFKIGLIYTFSNVIIKGIAFLTTPIFTRLMTQTEYGEFSSISSWANIISIVVTWGLYSSISRAKYDFEKQINSYMSTVVILGNIITAVFWIIIEANMPFFERLLAMNRTYIRSIMLYSFFHPAVQTLLAKYRMYGEYQKVIVLTWITLLVSTGASLALVIFMDNGLTGRVLGNYTIVAVVDIVVWLAILIRGRSFLVKMGKYACALSIPLVIHELSGIILNSSDRIIINQLCGARDAALYSIAYTIAMIMTVLLSSINQAWVPWFFDNLTKNNFLKIQKTAKVYTVVFCFACIFLMLIGPELVLLFGGKQYFNAIYVIPPVCMAIFFQFIYTFYVNIEFFLKQTIYISLATAGATIINIVLNFLLIPIWGYRAAAYTTIIGYIFMSVFHYLICRKTKLNNLFEGKIFLFSAIVCFIGMIVTLFLYMTQFLRIIILLLYIVILVVLFKKFKFYIDKFLNLNH